MASNHSRRGVCSGGWGGHWGLCSGAGADAGRWWWVWLWPCPHRRCLDAHERPRSSVSEVVVRGEEIDSSTRRRGVCAGGGAVTGCCAQGRGLMRGAWWWVGGCGGRLGRWLHCSGEPDIRRRLPFGLSTEEKTGSLTGRRGHCLDEHERHRSSVSGLSMGEDRITHAPGDLLGWWGGHWVLWSGVGADAGWLVVGLWGWGGCSVDGGLG